MIPNSNRAISQASVNQYTEIHAPQPQQVVDKKKNSYTELYYKRQLISSIH